MSKTSKPRETSRPTQPTAQKKLETELSENELDKVSGGKPCTTGKHIPTGTIIT
jgi:bacteriocin-like protein